MDDIAADTFQDLVEFSYTSRLDLADDNVELLLQAADRFQFQNVLTECEEYLMEKVTTSNCLGMQKFGCFYSCKKLTETAENYTMRHFDDVIQEEEFLQLEVEELLSYVMNENLHVKKDTHVVNSLLKWLDFDSSARLNQLPNVISTLGLTAQNHPNLDISGDHRGFLASLAGMKNFQLKIARKYKYKDVVLVCGGTNEMPGQPYDVMCYEGNSWIQLADMPHIEDLCQVAAADDKMAVSDKLGNLCIYDSIEDKWELVQNPESTLKDGHSLVIMGSKTFLIGGHRMGQDIADVQCFDNSTGDWSKLTSLPVPVSCAVAVPYEDKIYVLTTSVFQCLDHFTEIWDIGTAPPVVIEAGGVGAKMNNKIYFLDSESTVSYTPATNTWCVLNKPSIPRVNFGLTVFKERLFVAGGHKNTNNYYIEETLESIEYYDDLEDVWKQETFSLPYAIAYPGFVTISKFVAI
ncbi:kelch-like protein 23 [Glandiceps talaboti]